MEIWRKPESADWYYESAECVDDVTVDNRPWTNLKSIVFDATKDKDGGRHTDMKILLSAQEVRSLHQGLIRGQKLENKKKEANKKAERKRQIDEVKQLKRQLADEGNGVDAILSGQALNQKWYASTKKRLHDHYLRLGSGTRREAEVIRNQERLEDYVRTHGAK